MFGLFSSVEKQMRSNAANWLELAEKVYHYRRDVIPEVLAAELKSHILSLRLLLKEKDNAAKLKLGIEALEEVLRRTGGKLYPRSTVQEYVEFFVVAAIVVLGIRAYFLQPFKIPTNSMWPTYYGMTPEVYRDPTKAPAGVKQAVRFVLFGAQRRQMVAPASGRISVPIDGGGIHFKIKTARKWLVVPTRVREYEFRIEGSPVTVQVPEDFDMNWAFEEVFAHSITDLMRLASRAPWDAQTGCRWAILDKKADAGDVFFSFDIMTGDQLFVDRVSYHFVRPQVGEGFVFRTRGIANIKGDQYFVKRLVGTPGDTLEVRSSVLLRNGSPIEGAEAFNNNARQIAPYRGYANEGALATGQKFEVPENGYYAMGDNSYRSLDSRMWGHVPEKNVVGRPLFIYYPFTKRWGPTQ